MRALLVLLGLGVLAACQAGPDGPPGEGTQGPDGQEGPPGDDATSSLTSIAPAKAFLGRRVDVAISGSSTQWSPASPPLVDFGAQGADEIVVEGITVHSPTSLTATITVPPTAAIGLREVTVTDGDRVARLDGAFSTVPSLDAQILGGGSQSFGHLTQGSVVELNVFQLDLTTPFDLLPGNVAVRVGDVSPFHPVGPATPPYVLHTFMRIDVKAATGGYGIVVDSGPEGAVVRSATSSPFVTLEKRSPSPLFPGENQSSLPNPGESLLYRIAIEKDEILSLTVSGIDPDATADVIVLPASGRFEDLRIGTAKFGDEPVHVEALVQPPEAYVIYRGFGPVAEPQIGLDVEEKLPDGSIAPLGPDATVDGEILVGGTQWYQIDVPSDGQLTLTLEPPDLSSACGSAAAPAAINSELQLVDAEGRDLRTNDDIAGDNWCSALSYDVMAGATYYARVASSQRSAPTGTFSYRLVSELQ